MVKYYILKLTFFTLFKWQIKLFFSVRGNNFCIFPTIRWKGNIPDGWPTKMYYTNRDNSIHFMWFNILFGFRIIRLYK